MSFELIKSDVNINFIGHRRLTFVITGVLVCICLGAIISRGLVLGIDFAGGLLIQVRFVGETDPKRIREALIAADLPASNVQSFGGKDDHEYLISLQVNQELEKSMTAEIMLLSQTVTDTLIRSFGADQIEVRRVEMVGPRVGDDLRQSAISALFYSLLMIIIYISGRFEQKWGSSVIFVGALLGVIYPVSLFGVGTVYVIGLALLVTLALCYILKFEYALGAILALLHDVIVTVGLFAILDKEITLSFVAAILTIVGYSINDTIIIYDRIREQIQKSKKGDYAVTINRGINETLSRTILTSGTTLMVIVALYFLGGPGNQDFALALLIGISIGTFSSIAISAPTLLMWTKKTALKAG
ncbi:MAG: hypothetical protein AMR96_00780 [Candidatus Adiutrix intracellularis]|nr:MAG: hypothetical protein AMR96_00780 [Candidatus Adiutrix intracellularis]